MSDLRQYITVFENAISDELCAAILREYVDAPDWAQSKVGANYDLDNTVRDVESVFISHTINSDVRRDIDSKIFCCAKEVLDKYTCMYPAVEVEQDSGYELLRYGVGQMYKQHVDDFSGARRVVSCSFHINDDYEGGDWGFFDNAYRVKAPKGAAVMFPSNFVFPHQINPVTAGERFSIVTWFS
jgi:predicted 2-oxoglutarate/Fe(II)-dependent dioxygenase YbiX